MELHSHRGILLHFCAFGLSNIVGGSLVDIARKYNEEEAFAKQKPVLQRDEAYLNINSSLNFPVLLYSLNDECYKCPFVYVYTIPRDKRTTIVVNTTFGTTLQLRKEMTGVKNEDIFCSFHKKYRENGDYWLFIDLASYTDENCQVLITNDPPAAEMPILYVICGLVGLFISVEIILVVYRRRTMSANITDPDQVLQHDLHMKDLRYEKSSIDNYSKLKKVTSPTNVDDHTVKKERLKSLDTFRGISLVFMIFGNYGGGGYWFFNHQPWNGLTMADLVFPWFVFIMGTAMNYSFRSMLRKEMSKCSMLWKIIKRSVQLFALGIILNTSGGPWAINRIRIPGILQRFSLTYLFLAILEMFFARKDDPHKTKRWAVVRDIILFIPEWIIALGVLAAYICLTFLLPIGDCPTGYIGPGGLSEGGKYHECTGGAAAYIDMKVLGRYHIYQYPTPQVIYQTTSPHDPEGILGTLPSIFLCFLGLQSGRILLYHKGHLGRLIRWAIWAIIVGIIGAALCGFSKNDGVIPLNKNLWSVSFILVTASFGLILFSVLYIIIDVANIWDGEPFLFPGMNSIVVYCCHNFFYHYFPVSWKMTNPQHWELLLKAVWDTAIWVVLAYIMYRKKIFVAL